MLPLPSASGRYRAGAGVILRSFLPYKQKIIVLSENSGKISLVVRSDGVAYAAGSVITFCTTKNSRIAIANNVQFIYIPLEGDLLHLHWLHHILEICYYFVPLAMPCSDIFRLVLYCIKIGPYADEAVKKICLLRLLILLGFYPPDELVTLSGLFDRVVSTFCRWKYCAKQNHSILDSPDEQKVRSLRILLQNVTPLLKQADEWILCCLRDHPHAAHFKTLTL